MKQCKNCKTELVGEFCHKCGQNTKFEIISFKLIFQHLLDQIFSLDARFFSTMLKVVKNPAKLTNEYLSGQHKSHINPITLYLISSALIALALSYVPLDIDPWIDEINQANAAQTGTTITPEMREVQSQFARIMFENFRLANILMFLPLPIILRFLFSRKKFNRRISDISIFVLYLASALNFFNIILTLIRIPTENDNLTFFFIPIAISYFIYAGLKFFKSNFSSALKLLFAYFFMYVSVMIFSAVGVLIYVLYFR